MEYFNRFARFYRLQNTVVFVIAALLVLGFTVWSQHREREEWRQKRIADCYVFDCRIENRWRNAHSSIEECINFCRKKHSPHRSR